MEGGQLTKNQLTTYVEEYTRDFRKQVEAKMLLAVDLARKAGAAEAMETVKSPKNLPKISRKSP